MVSPDEGFCQSNPPEGRSIEEYKTFIDRLVRPSRLAKWVREKSWPAYETDLSAKDVNRLIARLSSEERELLARMLQCAEDVGTWVVLNCLDLHRYELSREGTPLPSPFPYGSTTLWGSWSYRKRGDAWPQGPGEVFESQKEED